MSNIIDWLKELRDDAIGLLIRIGIIDGGNTIWRLDTTDANYITGGTVEADLDFVGFYKPSV